MTEDWQELARRQLEEFTVTTQKYRAENQRLKDEAKDMVLAAAYYEMRVLRDAAVAEIQRLREGRAAVRRIALNEHATHTARLLEIEKLTREALAGDAE